MPDIVHIACKLPNGLTIGAHRVAGFAFDRGTGLPSPVLTGGYAITVNFPAEEWSQWLRANSQAVMVTRNLIFAEKSLVILKKKARTLAGTLSGLEQRRL